MERAMVSSISPFSFLVLILVLVSRVTSLQCDLRPSSLDDFSHSIETADAEEARVAALCHVVCINYALPTGGNSTNSTNGTDGGGGEPMTPVSSFVSVECLHILHAIFAGIASDHHLQWPEKGIITY